MTPYQKQQISEWQAWAAYHAERAMEERTKQQRNWERICRYHQRASAHWYEIARIALGTNWP